MNKYVVYVNHPRSFAKIHFASCYYSINRKAEETSHGYWSYEYDTYRDASDEASKTGKRDMLNCKKCNPS
jgi:hypothetical protein